MNRGEGALCGPKIDITLSDAMKRKFQCASIQVKQLPNYLSFNLCFACWIYLGRLFSVTFVVVAHISSIFNYLITSNFGTHPQMRKKRKML